MTRPSAEELLRTPDAFLTRTDLRDLGLNRRAVDAVFRALPVVVLPGYSRPMVKARDYLALVERFYGDTRVRHWASRGVIRRSVTFRWGLALL